MTPTIKQIDEAIKYLSNVLDMGMFYVDVKGLKTTLSTLQHVKQHGLAIGEEEITKALTSSKHTKGWIVSFERIAIAKAIAERMRVRRCH